MARHLTWCLRHTFLLTTRYETHRHPILVAKMTNYVAHKLHPTASMMKSFDPDAEENHRDLEMFVEDARCGREHAANALVKLLCISKDNAVKAVGEYPGFRDLQKKLIYESFHILRENGMLTSMIKDNKFLLLTNPEELKTKINLIKRLDIDINKSTPLFHMTVETLKRVCSQVKIDATYLPVGNKLLYLAEKFNYDISKICYALSYNQNILMIPAPKLMTITEYVLAAGMMPEHILADLTLYMYPVTSVKKKVEEARALGIHPLKPWIMRCSKRTWDLARYRFEHRGALYNPGMTREQLICEVFECDVDVARYVLNKNKTITTMAFEKLHDNLRLIRKQGYTVEEFILSTTSAQRSTRTLKKHFEMWNKSGLPKVRLCVFSKPTATLQQIISARMAELNNQH